MSFIENPTTAAAAAAADQEQKEPPHADGGTATDETRVGGNGSGSGDNGGGDDSGNGRKSKEEAQGVTFLYRLVVGQAHRSYGLNVARSAGMDEAMIELAARKSAEMRDR